MKRILFLSIMLLLISLMVQATELDISAKTPIGAGAVAIFEIKPNVELVQDISLQQIILKNNNSERITVQLTIEKQQNNTYLIGTNLPTNLQERITVSVEN